MLIAFENVKTKKLDIVINTDMLISMNIEKDMKKDGFVICFNTLENMTFTLDGYGDYESAEKAAMQILDAYSRRKRVVYSVPTGIGGDLKC